jgi:ABC-2 type transport system ATP-binding protein
MLRLAGVRKTYGKTVAVEALDLEIRRGEVFGLLGPNGAGKSTTVGLAVGLLEPDQGTVEIEGAGPPTQPAARAKIGITPQALALYEELSAEENLRFFGVLHGLEGSALAARVQWALDFVGLSPRAKDRASTYSGGMKRRLNLAIGTIHDPPLLLLDEPTVGVDPQSRAHIFEEVRRLNAAGATVVYTSHYMEEVQALCSRVGILDHGRLIACDPVEDLLRSLREPNLERVFLRLTGHELRD